MLDSSMVASTCHLEPTCSTDLEIGKAREADAKLMQEAEYKPSLAFANQFRSPPWRRRREHLLG
jgi:hypothetical protein